MKRSRLKPLLRGRSPDRIKSSLRRDGMVARTDRPRFPPSGPIPRTAPAFRQGYAFRHIRRGAGSGIKGA